MTVRSGLARALLVLVAVCLTVGCTVEVGPDDPASSPTAERVAEVRAARSALEEPVSQLVAATVTVRASAEQAQVAAESGAGGRASGLRGTAALDDARAALAAITLEGEGPDVAAARAAVADALDAAASLATAARTEDDELAELLAAEDQLAEVRASWDRPGARSQQITRLDAAATDAAAIADRLEDGDDQQPCAGLRQRLGEAAATVAERSAELRDHAQRRDGEAFDEARARFDAEPALGDDDVAAATACWTSRSAVVAAASRVEDAVVRLAAALDPEDLTASTGADAG